VSLTIGLEPLLDYSDHERRKWKDWVAAEPARLHLPVQRAARFPTVWSLLDHVFLVERRHLSRLEGGTPPDATGVAVGDWTALFEYADLVRADFRRYVADLPDSEGTATITFAIQSGPVTMTRRKLAAHVILHEVRHLAQLAAAARLAGHEPPGDHDLFFFAEFL
jgi:uncharacterized damage-inducible protein DinB